MSNITIEIDAIEALYAVNSISAYQRAVDKAVQKDKSYFDRNASLEGLKLEIMKSLKDQASMKDLRRGMEIIESQ